MLPQGAETPRNYLLAAESGGETVGELWCDTTEPETVFINDFFVYPACRGHGWGNAMLRAVEELAAAQSFEQVVTHVYHTNRIALAMFESAGFTQIGPPKGGNIFLRKRYMRSPFLA
ncbi:MAG: N-acetyltransferase family protein [Oscillospiraceae bacterium]